MKQALFKDTSPWVKLLFTLFIVFVSFTVFFLLGQLISGIFYGFNQDVLNPDFFNDPKNVDRLRLTQAVHSFGLFIFPAWMSAWIFSQHPKDYLGLSQGVSFGKLIWIFIFIISVQPIVSLLGELNQGIKFSGELYEKMLEYEKNAEELTLKILFTNKSTSLLIVNLIIVALIPALGEEMLFRGVLQRIFLKFSPRGHLAVWLTAFIFSAVHFQFFGFIPRLFLGALFGYLMLYSGNIRLSIIAHFLNNAMGVISYHYFYEEIQNKTLENTNFDVIQIGFNLCMSIIAFSFIVKSDKDYN